MNTIQVTTKRYDARSGQVLVIVAMAVVVMAILAALVIDVGYIRYTRARLQNAADAAAVAGGLELVEQWAGGASEETTRAAAYVEAQAIAGANCSAARCEVLFGEYVDGQFVELAAPSAATAVEVKMHRDDAAPAGRLALFFAPIAGLDSAAVHATAVSELARDIKTIRKGGMVPFAVHKDAVPASGTNMTIYDKDMPAPGNFGLLDFNGGLNATGDLEDWIINGYDGELSLDPVAWIEGNPGWRSALDGAIQQRVGDVIGLCIYDQVEDGGSNMRYRIVGFLAVNITQCDKKDGETDYIQGSVEYVSGVAIGETGGPVSQNLCKVQLVM